MTVICMPAASLTEVFPSAMVTVQAEEVNPTSGTWGENTTWTLDNNGTLAISGTGKVKSADWERDAIRKIVIGDGVTSIGQAAFHHCGNVISVSFPDSLESIEALAFEYCTKISSVTIPENMESIGSGAFMGCTALTKINIMSSDCAILGDERTICNVCELDGDDKVTSFSGVIHGYDGSTAQA